MRWSKLVVFFFASVMMFTGVIYAGDISFDARESAQGTISATAVAAVTKLAGAKHVVLVNRGADEVFIRFNSTDDAEITDFELKTGESLVMDATANQTLYQVGTICSVAEATTVEYLSWQ